ncbi:type I polyketide synthase [Pseudonocardia sp. NPDC049635]|uniref:type I polyketide synthase n=1 Tax=Pseudonocardia sp. NPDC049635 TaxID=3155506 RepID=UPI0033EF3107
MSQDTDHVAGTEDRLRDYLRRATVDLRTTRARLEEVRERAGEPLAIVGMSCRFPGGVTTPAQLWEAVDAGRDLVGPFPTDRGWDLEALYDPDGDTPGTSYVREGGFLDDVAGFDAAFFGIAPREAITMDPQQRLLLETTWEAFEDAGIDPTALRGSRTGVYLGATDHDYGTDLRVLPDGVEGQAMIGRSGAVSAGRVAYTLGLRGPVLTVDTMCSSSLVALHTATGAVRRDECELAVVAGTTVMSTPRGFVEFSRQRALSPDGRCRAFSADADGTGWAEGVGVLLVERLSVARERGHRVHAVVRGTAVNSDGASNGLTAPNGEAQQDVVRAALADARLDPGDVDAVEAHGTGTVLGDPIEVGALFEVYGRHRSPRRPLWLGSLKSNMGHAASAAGVGGVIKTVLALRHRRLPATLHAGTPTDKVDWSSGTVRLLDTARDWPDTGRARRAAVSAFGASGTNAHVVLEQAPDDDPAPAREPVFAAGAPVAFPLSARDPQALRAQAGRLGAVLAPGAVAAPAAEDVAHRLGGRAALTHRAVVVAPPEPGGMASPDANAALAAIASGGTRPGAVTGTPRPGAGAPVFVFPGQGAQWVGMARELLDTSPVFAERMAECAAALAPHLDADVVALARGDDAAWTGRVELVQPVLFATTVSLAALWRACGVVPAVVVGHSQGEVAAACVAGRLSLPDAARVVALRSRALRAVSGRGGMLSVGLSRAELDARLTDRPDLTVAAENGARSCVVAGPEADLDALAAEIESAGRRARRIPVDYASHSPQMEEVRAVLAEALAPVGSTAGEVPMHSTVTGRPVAADELDGAYWFANLRSTVRLDAVVTELLAAGHDTFVEVSPHPVLLPAIEETADATGREITAVATLRRDEGGPGRVLGGLAELWVHGGTVDWCAPVAAPAEPVDLPPYPFTRTRYWLTEPASPATATGHDATFWDLVTAGDAEGLNRLLTGGSAAVHPGVAELLPVLAAWRYGVTGGDPWRYRVGWDPLPAPPTDVAGDWLLLLDGSVSAQAAAAGEIGSALGAHGATVTTLDLAGVGHDRAAVAAVLRGHPAPARGCVSVLAVGHGDGAPYVVRGAADVAPGPGRAPAGDAARVPPALAVTIATVQALGDVDCAAPLWVVTRGAAEPGPDPVGGGPAGPDAAQAAVWGLGRCVALEHPDRWGGLVDLPPDVPGSMVDPALLAGALSGTGGEDQLAVRAGGLRVRRLHRAAPAGTARAGDFAERWGTGPVLVTGGTGAIGRRIARWLSDLGVRELVLTGRRGADADGIGDLVADLAVEGTTVTVEACDAADRAALTALRDRCAARGTPLRAAFHVAGAGSLEPVAATGPATVAATVHAKIAGAEALDAVLGPDVELVLFSSISAVWGSADHGAYAAGNAHLDALATRRRARGRAAVSVVWGIWDPAEDGGMAANLVEQQLRDRGVPFMSPARSLATLHRVLADPEPVEVVADVDWARFAPVFTGVRPSPLIGTVPEAAAALAADRDDRDDEDGPGTALAERLAGLTGDERARLVREVVRAEVAAALGFDDPAAVGTGRPFRELGLDSLGAMALRRGLTAAAGVRIPVTAVFDHPTVAALAAHVADRLAPVATGPAAGATGTSGTDDPGAAASGTDDPGAVASDIDDLDVESLMRLALDGPAS